MSPMRQQFMAVEQQVLPCPFALYNRTGGCALMRMLSVHERVPSCRHSTMRSNLHLSLSKLHAPPVLHTAHALCTVVHSEVGCHLLKEHAWPSCCSHIVVSSQGLKGIVTQ